MIRETRTLQYSKTASTTKELTYLYDNLEIVGLIYITEDGTNTYYYDKNIFGDVVAILDNTGNTVVKYKYDAYGNCTVYDSTNSDLAEINPIRYRSYYYDAETGLYYLESRYYNPEWRRFISPDNTSYLEPEILTGLNLYCYCGNDPINYADPTGHSAILIGLIIGAAVGAGIGFGTAAYIDYQDDGQIFNGSVTWYDYLGATVLGGVVGAGIGAGLGAFSGMSFSATFPTGFASAQASTGAIALVATETTLTLTGTQILGVAGLLGATYMFAKGGLPNNQHQNEQWKEAMRQLKIDKKNYLWRKLHDKVQHYPYSTHDTLDKLIRLLKEILREMGKL